jgi:hypothetical protein
MSFTPYNEVHVVVRGNPDSNGIDTRAVNAVLQGNEIRDPLQLHRRTIPYMGMRYIRTDENGLIDKSIEINDLGQSVRASTTAFVDTTEKWTPQQIIQGNLSPGFLRQLDTQQAREESNDGDVSVFEMYGIEVPFTSRGTKSSIESADPYRGWQNVSPSYVDLVGIDNFLDGQEVILGIPVPPIQEINKAVSSAYNDAETDDTDRFGINILNQNVNLYDRYAAGGFVYDSNTRDSIAFGGLKG